MSNISPAFPLSNARFVLDDLQVSHPGAKGDQGESQSSLYSVAPSARHGAQQAQGRARPDTVSDMCSEGTTCLHYPYGWMPFLNTYALVFWTVMVFVSFVLLLTSLCLGHWTDGISLANKLGTGSGTSTTGGIPTNSSLLSNQTLSADGRYFGYPSDLSLDKRQNLWVYVLLFRFIPTLLAPNFAIGFMSGIDLNHRFVQPFLAMRGPSGGMPDETVLLAYSTASPIEVPQKAFAAGHYKVAFFSILNTVSTVFPIYVASIYTIVNTGDRIYLTYSPLSFSVVFAFLIIYNIALFMVWPCPHRLMPRQRYNLVETVAMCHASYFARSEDLENTIQNATQEYMYDRIRLCPENRQDRYVYGGYLGVDGKWHLGFDVAERDGRPTGSVRHIPVELSKKGWFGPLRRRRRRPISKGQKDNNIVTEETEMDEMYGA